MITIKDYYIYKKENINQQIFITPNKLKENLNKLNKDKFSLSEFKNNLSNQILILNQKIKEKKDLEDYYKVISKLNEYKQYNIKLNKILNEIKYLRKYIKTKKDDKNKTFMLKNNILDNFNKRINLLTIKLIKN